MSERLTDSGAPEAAAGEDSTVMGGLQGGVSGAFGPESLAEAAAGKQYPGAKPTAGEEQHPWGILGRAQHAVVAAAHRVAETVGNAAAEAASSAGALVGLPLMDGVAGPAGAPRPAPEEPGREGNITLPEDRVTPTASDAAAEAQDRASSKAEWADMREGLAQAREELRHEHDIRQGQMTLDRVQQQGLTKSESHSVTHSQRAAADVMGADQGANQQGQGQGQVYRQHTSSLVLPAADVYRQHTSSAAPGVQPLSDVVPAADPTLGGPPVPADTREMSSSNGNSSEGLSAGNQSTNINTSRGGGSSSGYSHLPDVTPAAQPTYGGPPLPSDHTAMGSNSASNGDNGMCSNSSGMGNGRMSISSEEGSGPAAARGTSDAVVLKRENTSGTPHHHYQRRPVLEMTTVEPKSENPVMASVTGANDASLDTLTSAPELSDWKVGVSLPTPPILTHHHSSNRHSEASHTPSSHHSHHHARDEHHAHSSGPPPDTRWRESTESYTVARNEPHEPPMVQSLAAVADAPVPPITPGPDVHLPHLHLPRFGHGHAAGAGAIPDPASPVNEHAVPLRSRL